MLSSVFKFCLSELSTNFVICDLMHSFELECPSHPVGPPAWDLSKVLSFLRSSAFDESAVPLIFSHRKMCGGTTISSVRIAFCGSDLSLMLTRICREDGIGTQSDSMLFLGAFVDRYCWRFS